MLAQINRWNWVIVAIASIVVAWFMPAHIGRYYTQMLSLCAIFIIASHGLNLLAGYVGQVSLAIVLQFGNVVAVVISSVEKTCDRCRR